MRAWTAKPKIIKTLKPSLLSQPNIPKPLHGINPRTIMGKDAWDKHRQLLVVNSPYCKACGRENTILDLHEDYSIDYTNNSMILLEYAPLCKKCHMFIHSGFLYTQIKSQDISIDKARDILRHGISILEKNNLQMFIATSILSKNLKVKHACDVWSPPPFSWDGWKLLYKGKEYKGLSKTQWIKKYGQ